MITENMIAVKDKATSDSVSYDNAKTITKGKLSIVLIDGSMERAKAEAANIADIIDRAEVDTYKCTGKEYIETVNKLCQVAEDIISKYPEQDIFSYLPLTKSGDFAKGKSILLMDTKITNTFNQDYFSQQRLQLRLVRTFATEGDWLKDVSINNVLALEVSEYGSSSKTPPVFDADGVPHVVEQKRAKYLKDDEIKAGAVYAEAKGTEYFYMGYYSVTIARFRENEKDEAMKHLNEKEIVDIAQVPMHLYVRLTKKVKARVQNSLSLQDFIDSYILENIGKGETVFTGMSTRENPRKFASQTEVLFENAYAEVVDHTISMDISDEEKRTFMCRIRPMTPGQKYVFP